MSDSGDRGRVVALVPMRHGSERVPNKNHRNFLGRPLCLWVIDALLESGVVDEVLVDTDSPPVREICVGYSSEILVVDRPGHLAGGMVSMNDVISHDLGLIEADVVVQTHATNPLLRAATIACAVGHYHDLRSTRDSLFSVTRHQARFYSANGAPVNHDPERLERTQDLEAYYEENSCLYVFSPRSFHVARARIGRSPVMLELDAIEAVDIDDERDFVFAESVARSGVVERCGDPALVLPGSDCVPGAVDSGSAA